MSEEGAVVGVADSAVRDSQAVPQARMDKTLVDMQPYFHYFTVAPLLTRGRLDFDPVSAYIEQKGDPALQKAIFLAPFGSTLFEGVDPLGGNLWLARSDQWPDLSKFLDELAWSSTPKRELYQVEKGTLVIPDPLGKVGTRGHIYVTAYGVTGNKCRFAFNRESPPRLVSLPLDPAVVAAAKRLFLDLR